MEFYQISDFAKAVGRHTNTVDNWFKALEDKRVHYVGRAAGSKVYDELDLDIANFIRDKRDEKWSLEGIFNILPEHFDLRPFPQDYATSVPQVLDMDAVMGHLRVLAEEIAAAQVEEVRHQYEEIIRQLPKPLDPLEEKQKRVTDAITQRRVISQLEEEAFAKWNSLPSDQRLKPAGWLRKVEDTGKRDLYIRNYVNEHYQKRLTQEYGIDKE